MKLGVVHRRTNRSTIPRMLTRTERRLRLEFVLLICALGVGTLFV